MNLEEYMTVSEVAKLLDKSVPMITHLCRSDRLPGAVKLSTGAWLVPIESAKNYTPNKRGRKPGATKKQRLAEERGRYLKESGF